MQTQRVLSEYKSSLPFGFWSVWDAGQLTKGQLRRLKSSLPFGFWSVWDPFQRTASTELTALSSLPFGFWSVWDNILSTTYAKRTTVFIAFRLLVCLGPDAGFDERGAGVDRSSLPFGFWSVWDPRNGVTPRRTLRL